MKFSRGKIDLFIAFSLFFQNFLPSIKLIWSSSVLNGVSMILMIISLIFSGAKIDKVKNKFIIIWSIFGFILLILYFWKDAEINNDSFKLVYMLLTVYMTVFVFNKDMVKPFVLIVILWSLTISLWQLLLGVPTNYSLGQSYLTVALPIGSGLTISLLCVTTSDMSFSKKSIIAACLLVQVLALSTLLSRAALMFPFFIFSIVFPIWIIGSTKIGVVYKFLISIVSIGSVLFAILNFESIVNDRQLARLERLKDVTDEPRYYVYSKAISLILDSPVLGYGTGSTAKVFNGTYPHNIFLDILFNGGIILLLPFLCILAIYFKTILSQVLNSKMSFENVSLLSISLFMFMQWNISFGLDTIYIPISTMMIFCINYYLRINK
ncbi:O-antigen ligase family protein [Vibrio fluvialis]|nr:O-antigen ligase family protein [Vibrio fluvialis]